MESREIFVIFPYLKTREDIRLRGILLRSSDNLDGLSPEQQAHLRSLFAMFFLRNDQPITHMTYAYLALDGSREYNQSLIDRSYDVQSLLNYRYALTDSGDPSLHFEHSSIYVFEPDTVTTGLMRSHNQLSESVDEEDESDGYACWLNGRSDPFWIVPGRRLYPPTPHLMLEPRQDLALDVWRYIDLPENWAEQRLFLGSPVEDTDFNERIFTALDWHNKSTKQDIDEPEALLDLAVAFECLLNLENGEKLTQRFRETIMTLLGAVPRLDSWTEQFYNTRSAIAHKGNTKHGMFYAVDRLRAMEIHKGKDTSRQPAVPYRTLTSYGRRIFRLCLNAILSGATIARDAKLAQLFIHNQERLELICQQLGQTKATPIKRLFSIEKTVRELHEYSWDAAEHVRSETLIEAGSAAILTYLALRPPLSEEDMARVHGVLGKLKEKSVSADEKLSLFGQIPPLFRSGPNPPSATISPAELAQCESIVFVLLNYVVSPGFSLRKFRARGNA